MRFHFDRDWALLSDFHKLYITISTYKNDVGNINFLKTIKRCYLGVCFIKEKTEVV